MTKSSPYVVSVKWTVKILSIFVAFSESMNFTTSFGGWYFKIFLILSNLWQGFKYYRLLDFKYYRFLWRLQFPFKKSTLNLVEFGTISKITALISLGNLISKYVTILTFNKWNSKLNQFWSTFPICHWVLNVLEIPNYTDLKILK